MKAGKWIGIVLVGYIALVVVFETAIGVAQPQSDTTIVIMASDADGNASERVVSGLRSGDKLYIAANHWPRAWYNRTLENPDVEVVVDGERSKRRAVPVTGAEHDSVNAEHSLPLPFRFVTGFPPRYLIRLDPR